MAAEFENVDVCTQATFENVRYSNLSSAFNMDIPFLVRVVFAVLSCLFIVRRGLKKKSLDLTGAVASVVVGFILTLSNLCFFASCVTFFLTSSELTRFKSDVKEKVEDDFKKGLYHC